MNELINNFKEQKRLAIRQFSESNPNEVSEKQIDEWFEYVYNEKIKDSWFEDTFTMYKEYAQKEVMDNKLFNSIFADLNKEDFIIMQPNFELFHKKTDYPRIMRHKKIPFNRIFFDVRFFIENNGSTYGVVGFFIIKYDENRVVIFAPIISQGGNGDNRNFNAMMNIDKLCNLDKDIIYKENSNEESRNFFGSEDASYVDDDVSFKVRRKIIEYIFLMLDLIKTKEYDEYLYYNNGKLIKDKIIYEQDVKAHRKHFWKQSYYKNIYSQTYIDLLNQGYLIDRVVYKGGIIYNNIPYKLINSYKKDGQTKKENRVIELLEKKEWKNQNKLGQILKQLFPDDYIRQNDRKAIKPLELDFNIIKKKIAFEYDGEQHFNKELCETVFKSDFEELQKRDRKKEHLCRNKGIRLIRVKYNEPLTISYIKKKLKECDKNVF